ncbi:penicillin-binding transpeptidase domain-containing protein [Bacillus massiliglaciei]|uniref:penicillin-binding transpeptidase domain-containing protein n=1 Tax=Bacillus massiliglaciei TaxID=1816693 RepID=UPI000AF3B895|nr:penicillin-binding transpeptidase domain-containing protein [Bacillus massiliglaciei]
MKKLLLLSSLLFISVLWLAGCSDDEPTPEERFAAYTNLWNKQEFAKMYDYLSADTKKKVSLEEFTGRYEKIYQDIEVKDLQVNYKQPEESAIDKDAKKTSLNFKVSMNTMAGPVDSDHKARLVKEEKDDKENWYIQWDESYIFPQLQAGEKISITSYPAIRGEIVDRNERGLAMNGTVAEVGIIPEQMANEKETISQAGSLLHMTDDEINQKLSQSWVRPGDFVPIKKLAADDTATIEKLTGISGVSIHNTEERVYPYKEAAAHLIGYVGPVSAEDLKKMKDKGYSANDVIGKRGLEQILEDRLKGKSGAKIYIKAENGEEKVIAEQQAEEGETIVLTIDAELQKDIFNQYKGDKGSAAAIHPKTGETLALVSSPSFDPNKYVLGISASEQKELTDNPDKPLINRFSSVFAPGSTMKAITSSVALKNGVDPKEAISIKGKTWQKKNWKDHSITRVADPGIPIDMQKALIYSDNIYFAQKALGLGTKKFTEGLKAFGFEEKMPFDYPITSSKIGDISSEGRLADSGYGQAQIQMSAIHLASAYSAFLNEGNMLAPSLIVKDKMEPKVWKKNVLSAEQADLVKNMLTQVVENPHGSAHKLNGLDIPLAAKTGTAEIKASKNAKGTENGWIAVMNTENPELLMTLMVEDVKDRGGSKAAIAKAEPILKKYVK